MDAFIGEVRVFAGSYAPAGWAFCNGQLLAISQYQALFSLLGNTYGGDGRTTFALPDLRGAAPLMAGQGTGLSPRALGEGGGAQAVKLTTKEMPSHTHVPNATKQDGDAAEPTDATWSRSGAIRGAKLYAAKAEKSLPMSADAFGRVGGDQPHNNMPPYLTLSFIIALDGIFPART